MRIPILERAAPTCKCALTGSWRSPTVNDMPLYFLLLDAAQFHERIRPALAACWRQRSFDPCRALAEELTPAIEAFGQRYHARGDVSLLMKARLGLPFDRDYWTLLAGEALLYAAAAMPEIEVAPETLCCLLAPERYRQERGPREQLSWVEQTYYGSRDLCFGGRFYRPEDAGINDGNDVVRLTAYLDNIDPQKWSAVDLAGQGEAEPDEELAFVREWFPALQDLYRGAAEQKQVVVCEVLSPRRDY